MAGAAAGTATFRSMATKMARALQPHRVITARGLHGSTSSAAGVGRSSPNPSRLSTTSSGSSATTSEDLATRNEKAVGQVRDHIASSKSMQDIKAQFITTNNTCVAVFVFGGGLFYTFVRPRLNTLEDRADTLSGEVFSLKQEVLELKRIIKDEEHKGKIDNKAQSTETGAKST